MRKSVQLLFMIHKEKLLRNLNHQQEIEIDLSNENKGMYLLYVESDKGNAIQK